MTSVLAVSIFIAAQILYVCLFFFLRDRAQLLFSDETANQSAVQWFRERERSPYLFGYEPIMHAAHRRLMALVPPDREVLVGRYLNFAAIFLHNIAMLALTVSLFGFEIGCLATAWWMVTCWGIGLHVGRLSNYTERAFGDFFVFIGFATFILIPPENHVLRVFLTALPWVIVWHSSKFGVQAISLVSLTATLLGAPVELLLGWSLSLVLSVALFGRLVMDQIKDQLWHLRWYWEVGVRYLDHDGTKQQGRGQALLRWLLSWRIVRFNLIFAPTIIPLVVAWFVTKDGDMPVDRLLLATVLVGLFCSFGKGAILGSGVRYVYILLPIMMGSLLLRSPMSAGIIVFVELLLSAALTVKTLSQLVRASDHGRAAALSEVLQPLAGMTGTVIPSSLRIGEVLLAVFPRPDFKIATFGQSREYLAFVSRYYTPYPELIADQALVNGLVSRYSVDAVVVDKRSSAPALVDMLRNAGMREIKSVDQFALFVRG